MSTLTNIFQSDERFPLYQQYGETDQTRAFISLNIETGEVDANSVLRGNTSFNAWNDVELNFPIPDQLNTDAINEYISDIWDDMQCILDDSEVDWDGSNNVGKFGDTATRIIDTLVNPYDTDRPIPDCGIIDDIELWLDGNYEIETTLDDLADNLFALDGDDNYYFSDELNNIDAIKSALLDCFDNDVNLSDQISEKQAHALIDSEAYDYTADDLKNMVSGEY